MVTQKVRVVNPGLSDEQARTVLGTLGLTGAKAVRKVGLLSGTTTTTTFITCYQYRNVCMYVL